MCGACACGPATDEACSGADVKVYELLDDSCQNAALDSGGWDGQCNSSPNVVSATSAKAGPIGASGVCASSGGDAVLPDVAFLQKARVCSAPGGLGCGAAQTCVAEAGAPFVLSSCVFKTGAAVCPPAYDEQHLVFAGGLGEDTRGCSACTCDYAGTCPGTTYFYSDNICSSGTAFVDNDGSCKAFAGSKSIQSLKVLAAGAPAGACSAEGGAPTGGVTGLGPVTVCCLP